MPKKPTAVRVILIVLLLLRISAQALDAVMLWVSPSLSLHAPLLFETIFSIDRPLATAIDALLVTGYLVGLVGVITRQKWNSAMVGGTAILDLLVTYLFGGGLVAVASDFIAILMLVLLILFF
jgi:hypothetical protein